MAPVVLAFNSLLVVYSPWGDAGAVAFVLAADAALLLLFLCLRRLERDRAAGRGGRRTMKAAVLALTTALTAMFASKVAPLMPIGVDAVVWLMALGTAGGGFWALFLN
ncbi:hypothetical protein U9M48_029795 [Paspalum notatum var. saurae]|uniref:Uncharacterized protein n=1 Tax=Paspalum notatum var. saurae TaxID=547442 RepID=A0AAQ3X2M0_PASNO